MLGTILRFAAVATAALVVAPPTYDTGGPSMLVGATEDAVRSTSPIDAKVQMDRLVAAGFRGVRITQTWAPGQREVSADDAKVLQNVASAALIDHVTVVTSVMNVGSKTTPLTDEDQLDFAAYAVSVAAVSPALRILIVGNEPNLNRYWLPQFADDGSDAAALAYESLLARTYDAVKAASPGVTVLGGAVSPRGGDVAGGIRPTHSPTAFIHDLGQAYRDSGRTTPIMDGFAFHPYEDNSSVAPSSGLHPSSTTIALADYSKLVASLTEAFDGTAQEGSTLPIWYDEFGVESQIPVTEQGLYSGTEPATTKPVTEETQAAYYREAVQLAFCQPNVRGLFLFHTVDETDLLAWQSGVYYADGTPKTSLGAVKEALDEARRGVVAECPGMALAVHPKVVQRRSTLTLTCDLDCSYVAQLYRLPGKLLLSRSGTAIGGKPTKLPLRAPKARGSYRLRLAATASLNAGPAALLRVRVRRG
jgi:hypothetical protein